MNTEAATQRKVYFEIPKWAVLLDAETHDKVLEAPRDYCLKVAEYENWIIVERGEEKSS
jgi:hypothetical protein